MNEHTVQVPHYIAALKEQRDVQIEHAAQLRAIIISLEARISELEIALTNALAMSKQREN